ncbi:MAG: 4-hydroxy-tetrahydrodipicolinate synthase [Gemmatimonadetes bacterium]|nr:4-hydroxy-tetrahydrodipicolinate synthase [Gemmatimonadota bacterium]
MLPNGTGAAIVTPFSPQGDVDHEALAQLVDWQIAEGVDFLVACGSDRARPRRSLDERLAVTATVVRSAAGRVPVLAGATDNATARAIDEAQAQAAMGVAGIMSAAPYYNKPTQAGLEAHFRAIADAIHLPLLLYNVPGRTGVDLRPETVARLAEHPRIGGIKEASGSVRRVMDLVAQTPSDFVVLCGDDDLVVPAIAAGARGLISVASNALPRAIATIVRHARAGDFATARADLLPLLPFIDLLFTEANPIPVKAALAMQGRIGDTVRLPLLSATAPLRERMAPFLPMTSRLGVPA